MAVLTWTTAAVQAELDVIVLSPLLEQLPDVMAT